MLKNYFKIAFRNLTKYKFISFVNLFGLTVGMTCCLVILTYILNETSYDRQNPKANRIYRVTRSFNNQDGVISLHLGAIAPPFGPLLQHDFPDIQKITRVLPNGSSAMQYGEKIFNEQNIFFADENLFDVLNVKVLRGNPQTALKEPFSVMLTPDLAKKYFGDSDPIDKMVRMDNQYNMKVTGIYEPLPTASHLHPDILLSFNTLKDSSVYGEKNLLTNFGNNAFYTYLLLPENYPAQSLEARFPSLLDKSMHPAGAPGDFKSSKYTRLYLQKLTDIHLRSHLDEEIEENGSITRVYVFGAIALFILLIACINYMNLSTARSALRAREIGIRKVAGAQRREIILQFLSESVIIAFLSILLAIVLAWLILPWLRTITGQTLSLQMLASSKILVPLILSPVIVGCLSGIYPALFMSAFRPATVLKGLFKPGGGSISFRKVLVVAQFSISIILIISTAVVFQQLRYMQNKALGFDKEKIVTLSYSNALDKAYESFRSDLMQNSSIRDVARSSRIPSGRLLDEMGASIEAGDSLKPVNADIKFVAADYDFVPAYSIPVVAGRNFSRSFTTDTSAFLLNVASLQTLGMKSPAEVIGKNFQYGNVKGKVIGVFGDFNFESMHQKILPLALIMPTPQAAANSYGRVSVKIRGNNINAALAHIERTWKKHLPETPYEYSFLDEKFDQLYKSEQRQGTLFTAFSGIAIFIACLGLFGLSAFAITQRIKEIGIRKVLGASAGSIVSLLSWDFLKLVAIAALIAFPLAWYAMNRWLQDFAYRIEMHWWLFLLAGVLASVVALATISFLSIRAAVSNPVKSLRSE
jgi:putative ABC transport system permease protein